MAHYYEPKGPKRSISKINWPVFEKNMILEFFMQRGHFAGQSAHVQHHHQNCQKKKFSSFKELL